MASEVLAGNEANRVRGRRTKDERQEVHVHRSRSKYTKYGKYP